MEDLLSKEHYCFKIHKWGSHTMWSPVLHLSTADFFCLKNEKPYRRFKCVAAANVLQNKR